MTRNQSELEKLKVPKPETASEKTRSNPCCCCWETFPRKIFARSSPMEIEERFPISTVSKFTELLNLNRIDIAWILPQIITQLNIWVYVCMIITAMCVRECVCVYKQGSVGIYRTGDVRKGFHLPGFALLMCE